MSLSKKGANIALDVVAGKFQHSDKPDVIYTASNSLRLTPAQEKLMKV
jgi:hypothetical protein